MERFYQQLCAAGVFVCALFVCSCADSAPSLAAVSAKLICEYTTAADMPAVSLSVFVQPISPPERVDSLTLIHNASGLEWRVSHPVIIGNGRTSAQEGSAWVGSGFIMPANGCKLPSGAYTVVYTDLAGRTAVLEFALCVSENLYELTGRETAAEYGGHSSAGVLIYAADNTLLYCGEKKPEWDSFERVRLEYENAACIREYIAVQDTDVICIMPEMPHVS